MWMLFLLFLFFAWPFLLLLIAGFTAQSLLALATAPQQLWGLAKDKARRRNHALEHATINVLEERYGPTQISGMAYRDGFALHGAAAPQVILDAAREALRRLQAGEKNLALHPRCGSTMLAANLVGATSFLVLLLAIGRLTLLSALLAMLISSLLSRPLGALLQRFMTTSTDVEGVTITDFEYDSPQGWVGLFRSLPTQFRIYTSQRWVVLDAGQGKPL